MTSSTSFARVAPDGKPVSTTIYAGRSNWIGPPARRDSRREKLLKLIRGETGLSRGEILERMGIKGDKSGEMSVSNALTTLVEKNQVGLKGGKYRAR